ncbi:ATP-binding protein [Streptomyces sp. NPDC059708]|uniref:ATP-binding protein n=1 Tax=Streptomyces sp. NPDC059708 TaxID=3346916 RepID=UPI0036A1B159
MKGILERLRGSVGGGGARSAPPPEYQALADGLMITSEAAWAWYVISTTNSDLLSEAARDAQVDRAAAALASSLAGATIHLKVMWAPEPSDAYVSEMAGVYTTGEWRRWAEERADRLDDLALPVRWTLLGVRIGTRSATASQRVAAAAGVGRIGVSGKELAEWHAKGRRLGRRLESSPWQCSAAPVSVLAWMVAREQHRVTPVPAGEAGVVSGAALAALTEGRAIPYPDHLRLIGADGATAAWVSVLTMPGFPTRMETPGPAEWVRMLAEIAYAADPDPGQDDDPEGFEDLLSAVNPELSLRGRVLPKRQAVALAGRARKVAREQQRSADGSRSGDAGRLVEQTDTVMADLLGELAQGETTLVEDHPRIVVTSTRSLDDLRARTDAVITYYGDVGIEVRVGAEEQADLWLETWAGDQLRVPDLGHTRSADALAATWFWGGAKVGDDTGPVVGYLTGSTPGTVRLSLTATAARNSATTVALIGRSGLGKTTTMAVLLLDAVMSGGWAMLLDFKGDLAGVANAARAYGLRAPLVETDRSMAGAADLMVLLADAGREVARTEVPAQLSLVVPAHLRAQGAEVVVQAATNAVMSERGPATWRVIEHLMTSPDPLARATGQALYELSETPLGAPFMGRPHTHGAPPLSSDPGLLTVQMPGLSLPGVGEDRSGWTSAQCLSVGLMHSMLAYAVIMAGRRDRRTLLKAVGVPEAHVLTATPEGRRFLSYIARVGRALGTHLILDSQDAETFAGLVGVLEQITTLLGFQLTSPGQQDALAQMLGLEPGPETRALIHALGIGSGDQVHRGHCIVRDHIARVAGVQIDLATDDLRELLDTSPQAAAAREAHAAQALATTGGHQ